MLVDEISKKSAELAIALEEAKNEKVKQSLVIMSRVRKILGFNNGKTN